MLYNVLSSRYRRGYDSEEIELSNYDMNLLFSHFDDDLSFTIYLGLHLDDGCRVLLSEYHIYVAVSQISP